MSSSGLWDLLTLDGASPAQDLGSLAISDGDGHVEIVTAGNSALLWCRPTTFERGVIDLGIVFQVGLVLEDLDGDGLLEVIVGDCDPPNSICWYKPTPDLRQPWQRHAVAPAVTGSPHNLLAVDLDGDGEKELVASAIDGSVPSQLR
jgi:hypothetical protein